MVSLMSMQTRYRQLHVVNHHLDAFTILYNMIVHRSQLDVLEEGHFVGLPNGYMVTPAGVQSW